MVRVLTTLLLCTAVVCWSQENSVPSTASEVRFGVKGGGHVSFYRFQRYDPLFQTEVIPIVTVLVGGFAEIPVVDILDVEVGLEHMWKGAAQYTPLIVTQMLSYQAPAYIQVPVKLVAKLGDVRVGLGGYAAYGISGEYANSFGPAGGSRGSITFDNNDPDGINPWDLGITAELGYMLGQFRLSVYNYTGFTNVLSKARTIDDSIISNVQIGLGLAYIL